MSCNQTTEKINEMIADMGGKAILDSCRPEHPHKDIRMKMIQSILTGEYPDRVKKLREKMVSDLEPIYRDVLKENFPVSFEIIVNYHSEERGIYEITEETSDNLKISTEQQTAIDTAIAGFRQELYDAVSGDNIPQLELEFARLNKEEQVLVKDGVDFVQAIVSNRCFQPDLFDNYGDPVENPNTLKIIKSSASAKDGSMNVKGILRLVTDRPAKIPSITAHELGHYFEQKSVYFRHCIYLYLEKRTGIYVPKEPPINRKRYGFIPISKRLPIHYMNKFYPQGGDTELLSVGLEYLYKNPFYLAKSDPETFDFLVTLIQN